MALVRKIEEPVNSESTWAYGGAEQRLDCIGPATSGMGNGWSPAWLRGRVAAWYAGVVRCTVEANLNEGKNH